MHPGTAVATPRAPFARLAARFGRADTHRSLAADALPNSAERSSVLRCCRAARNRIPNKRLPASVTLSHCRNFPAALLYCVLHAAHAPLPHTSCSIMLLHVVAHLLCLAGSQFVCVTFRIQGRWPGRAVAGRPRPQITIRPAA